MVYNSPSYLRPKLHVATTLCAGRVWYVINEYDLLVFKYADCNKNDKNKFEKNIQKGFDNTNRFCDEDINKFCLILLKGYP